MRTDGAEVGEVSSSVSVVAGANGADELSGGGRGVFGILLFGS